MSVLLRSDTDALRLKTQGATATPSRMPAYARKLDSAFSDWHFVLPVLLGAIAPFVHHASKLPTLTAPSCSSLLSTSYHPIVGRVVSALYEYLGTKEETCRSVNLQLHAANSILLYVVINQLLASQRVYSCDMRQQTSALAAILFAVHPIRAEVTEQVTGIDESLSLALCLVGVLCLLSTFADKVVYIYAPASVAFFIAGGLVKSNAADVPIVIAFMLALRVLKIPSQAGKRFMVGVCLFMPIATLMALELQSSIGLPIMTDEAAVSLASGSKRDGGRVMGPGDKRGGSRANGAYALMRRSSDINSSGAYRGNIYSSSRGATNGGTSSGWGGGAEDDLSESFILHGNMAISQVIWQQLDAFARHAAEDGAGRRGVHSRTTPPPAVMLGCLAALAGSVVHTLWCVYCGRRAHSWAVSLLAFSILCIRSAFFPSPNVVGSRTYLPGCFLSILLCT